MLPAEPAVRHGAAVRCPAGLAGRARLAGFDGAGGAFDCRPSACIQLMALFFLGYTDLLSVIVATLS
ncbi:hypothetical protein [Haloarchaeobius salinus]|uniref:hypothetical protein n=1 Tax=Haloarchaeobius salinus TaxID=1198298 RepID=UPI00210E0CAD|nr:hypothetical protein [Haloarchaeobius salinus]